MKWTKNDIEKYIQSKEYIDTTIIPLLPFHIADDNDAKESAFQSELLTIIANEIEKEITGRILLLPSYYYIKKNTLETEAERLNAWTDEVLQQEFEHTFYITFDSSWKKHEKLLEGDLIWLQMVKSGDIHSKEMEPVIRDQTKQMIELIRSYW